MRSQYPIKKLISLNLWLTTYFFILGFTITMASLGAIGLQKAIANSVLGAIILILNSFINLALLLYYENKIALNKMTYKLRFVILSYVFSFLVYFLVIFIHNSITHLTINPVTLIYVIFLCILVNTLILAFQNYLIIYDLKVNADIENARLKAANVDAANQLLRQQIHPHFLFNALNVLKSLYKVNSKKGEEYLIHLSDFLRAAVSNNNTKMNLLRDEIKLCIDYLEMQKIRFGEALTYSVKIDEEALKTGFVPSFSIQPLLENAIKHNELTAESPLHIYIIQENDRIRIINNLKLKATTETSTGSGLSNLSERYKILSNDELIIDETDDTFSVSIKILKNENSTR